MNTIIGILFLTSEVMAKLPPLLPHCVEHDGRMQRFVEQKIVTNQSGIAHLEEIWAECAE